MRILQVCHRYYPYTGGIQEHVRNVSQRLAEKHEVDIATTDTSGKLPREEIVDGIRVKVFRSWAPGKTFYLSKDLKKYLIKNSHDFDIVHAHNYNAFPALYAAQAKDRNKLVFTPHYHGAGQTLLNSLLHMPYKYFGKEIFEKADRIICVSRYERNLIVDDFRPDEGKIAVIPNGVDLEEFRNLRKRKKDYRSILYVGRLEKYKGIAYLIKALPKLGVNVVLDIVGKGSYKESLAELAGKLGVGSKVRFSQDLGREQLLQKYADADVFVLLSKHEAYGISVAEALAAKVPCIVANTSALTEWVDNRNTFGIDYPIDLDELAALVDSAMGKGVDRLKIPDWNEITEKLVGLYGDLVNIA